MYQKITVKQLIAMLLECNLDSYVEVTTNNKDKEGRPHNYYFTGVNTSTTSDFEGERWTQLYFHNIDFEKEIQQPKDGHWINTAEGFSPYECSECGSIEFKKSNYCPNCGARMMIKHVPYL